MTRVPRHMAEHCLNVREGCPLSDKRMGQAPDEIKRSRRSGKLVDAKNREEDPITAGYQTIYGQENTMGVGEMCGIFKIKQSMTL
ncbi:hypothetical protein Tco_0783861 [Tanacetum coccineum]